MEPILIVDEAPSNRKLTQRVLTAAGYDVRAVSDAGAALNALVEFRPSLVLTDLRLNGMDGLALTRRIKEDPASHHVAVIVVTGCDTEEDRRAAAHAGCDAFIVKPIDTRSLPSVVEAQLARRKDSVSAVTLPSPAELPEWAVPLCREFLAEGRSRCAALNAAGADASVAEIRAAAHVWAGLGGTFGYPEISTLARRVHERLGTTGSSPDTEVMGWLQRLQEQFDQAGTASRKEATLAPEMAAVLRGRRVAVTGFDAASLARISAGLTDAGAEVLDTFSGNRSAVDLVVAASDAASAYLERLGTEPGLRLLLVGLSPEDPVPETLLAAANLDFVADPWTVIEVLSRASRLLARRSAPVLPSAGPAGDLSRIVLADDDPTILTLLQATVQNSGMECAVAREGEEALQLVRSTNADAIVLDVMMPNMDGLEVLAAIRNDPALRRVRVLVLSALQQETDIVRAFALGADDYVTKPFSPVEVIARLKRLHRVTA